MTFYDTKFVQAAQRLIEAAERDWPSTAKHRADVLAAVSELKLALSAKENQIGQCASDRLSTEVINRLAHRAGSEMHRTTLGWPNEVAAFVGYVASVVRTGLVMPTIQPEFEAVRDKRMSELTQAQQDDALELWIRENVGWMGVYHAQHYTFLLARLDAARSNADWPTTEVPVKAAT